MGRFSDRFIAWLGYVGIGMGAVSIVLAMTMIISNVIMRYIFKSPLQGIEEYSAYLMLVVVYMGLAYAMRLGRHINVEVAIRWLPKRARGGLEVVVSMVGLALMSVYFWFAWQLFMSNLQHGVRSIDVSGIPMWIPQIFVWLGLLFLCLEMVTRTVKKLVTFSREVVEVGE